MTLQATDDGGRWVRVAVQRAFPMGL